MTIELRRTNMRETVFANIEGRKIFAGFIRNEVFEKEITERSIFRNSRSWGTEKEVIDKLKKRGVKKIRLLKKDSSEVYEISLDDFINHAFILDFPGKPEQLLVQLKHFDVVKERSDAFYPTAL